MAQLKQEVKNLNKNLDEHITEQRADFKELKDAIANLRGEFAGKWVEKIVIGTLIAFIGVLIKVFLG